MRIDELHLKAFGPFADRRLDFSRGTSGLHVIFGPNEAGKSSALRALTALLYGVDERTSDGFRHSNEQIRVGGRLTLADGREINCVRRKGRKNTLLSPTDNRVLDEALLAPFLAGVSLGVFSSMFGIDHQALVEGGAEILQHNGDVGSTLFAAALGNRRLQTLLAEFEGEAGELYRPNGSKYLVNKALAEFRDARRDMKDAALAVRDCEAHRQSLEDATRRLETISSEMATSLREQHVVARLTRILPTVALRRTHREAIADLGPVVELAADFGERRRALLSRKASAEEVLATGRRKQDVLRGEAATFVTPGTILDEERTIRVLHQRLGSYRKSMDDRPAIEGKRQQARNDARDILKRLRPDLTLDDIPGLRPAIMGARRPIQDLATRYQAVEAAERKARKALVDKDQEIASVREALQGFPHEQDAGPLTRAMADARRAGDLDGLRREAGRAEAKQERQCRDDLSALGLWPGPLESVHALPVPGPETAARHGDLFRLADERLRTLADDRSRTSREIAECEQVLAAMRLAGTVLTEQDLVQARVRREAGWALVKRAWLDHEDVTDVARAYDDARGLPAAYETTTAAADDVADRLRREADRVAAHAQAIARRDQLDRDLAGLDHREAAYVAARQAAHLAWEHVWAPSGITPQSPEEMRAWLMKLASVKERVTALVDKRAQTQALQETLAGHQRALAARIRELAAEPPGCGDTLGPFLDQADTLVARIDAIATKRKDLRRLTADRAKIAGDVEHASADLEAWTADWGAELRSLGQPPDARPAHVLSLVEGYTELFTKLDEEDDRRRRVYGIDQDIKEFEDEVRSFAARVVPDSDDAEIVRCVERLHDALTRATTDKTNRDAIDKQRRELAMHIEETDARLAMHNDALAALCREARCECVEDLEDAERRSDAWRSWRERALALDHEIVAAGDGVSLEDLVAQADATPADDLPARMERATRRLAELEQERERLRETKGAEENEMRRMTGISASADAAARAQEILADMRRHVETYLRIRVAALLLRKEVDRYRAANQDPLLVRGGNLFASLSCGSFATISSEMEEDEPRLVGVRPNGAAVHVGGMSSGTRDQLYLALRFATLERYLSSSESMPFVVDDILINFDDERALATLTVLAEFSAKTQVLLFTHHARIRDMAAALVSPHGVFVQDLP